MELFFIVLVSVVVIFVGHSVWRGGAVIDRAEFIDQYNFPEKIKTKILEQHKELNSGQADRVIEGMREYFHICNEAGGAFVSMPSEAIDTAWHEFILFTKQYSEFCHQAFGRFLHHSPAEDLTDPKQMQKGIRTAWHLSCSRSNIDARQPVALPMLFAMDASLGIENGIIYHLDCSNAPTVNNKAPHCATHSLGSCGGGTSHTDAGDSNAGGDAGSGCGSGCGGCGS